MIIFRGYGKEGIITGGYGYGLVVSTSVPGSHRYVFRISYPRYVFRVN